MQADKAVNNDMVNCKMKWKHTCGKWIMYATNINTVQRKTLMAEKSDEFDECMLNHQNFSYHNFALRKFQYCIILLFYGYNLLT